MTTLRCAYFGCMHPLFESDDKRRKYCSEECRVKANRRSAAQVASTKKYNAKVAADPVLKKQASYRSTERRYKTGKNLPKWMYS